jgi:hypothetical protein
MDKIKGKITVGVTEAEEASDIILDAIDKLIERQNQVVEIVKLVVLSTGGLPIEAIEKAKKLK